MTLRRFRRPRSKKAQRCVARPRVAGAPQTKTPAPSIQIPNTPIGIVDTLKAKLNWVADEEDIKDLLSLGGWKTISNGHCVTLKRSTDGLRIVMMEGKVWTEGSIPRVLGLTNDQQHRVTVAELLATFDQMTADLLPRTTADAKSKNKLWHVVRLDLAVNFFGPLLTITEIARKLNLRPHIRSAATVFEERGIAFYGKHRDWVCYRTDRRPGRGKLGKTLKGKKFHERVASQKAWKPLRFEYRFKTKKALRRLTETMQPGTTGLPFLTKSPDGQEAVTLLSIDYAHLHQQLAQEAARMGWHPAAAIDLPKLGCVKFALTVLTNYGDKMVELWSLLEECLSDREVRTKRKQVGLLQASKLDWSLVSLCWPRPRISETLRRKMLAQIGVPTGGSVTAA